MFSLPNARDTNGFGVCVLTRYHYHQSTNDGMSLITKPCPLDLLSHLSLLHDGANVFIKSLLPGVLNVSFPSPNRLCFCPGSWRCMDVEAGKVWVFAFHRLLQVPVKFLKTQACVQAGCSGVLTMESAPSAGQIGNSRLLKRRVSWVLCRQQASDLLWEFWEGHIPLS